MSHSEMPHVVVPLVGQSDEAISASFDTVAHRIKTDFDQLVQEMNTRGSAQNQLRFFYKSDDGVITQEDLLEGLVKQNRLGVVPALANLVKSYIASDPPYGIFQRTAEAGAPAMFFELRALVLLSPDDINQARDYYQVVASDHRRHLQAHLLPEYLASTRASDKDKSALKVFFLLDYLAEGGDMMDFGHSIVEEACALFEPVELGEAISEQFQWYESSYYGHFIQGFGVALSQRSDFHAIVMQRLKQEL